MKYNTILILAVLLGFFVVIFASPWDLENTNPKGFKDLDGKVVDFDKYKKKYSILVFTFMSCPSICPMTNQELARVKNKYKDNVNIVSINVDPKKDTPSKLKEYMQSNNYDWDILIADKKSIKDLMENILHYDRADQYLESPAYHPPGLHLMDKNFKYMDKNFFPIPQDVDDLIDELNRLLEE